MPTTHVIIVRHAEKDPREPTSADDDRDNIDLIPTGVARAERLGRLLKRLDHPLTAVYTSRHLRTRRTAEVALRAGEFSGVSCTQVAAASAQETADQIVQSIRGAARSNDLVLVVHHTSTIHLVAEPLRPPAPAGPARAALGRVGEEDFDRLWVIAIGDRTGENLGSYRDLAP